MQTHEWTIEWANPGQHPLSCNPANGVEVKKTFKFQLNGWSWAKTVNRVHLRKRLAGCGVIP